jgi:D-cysteine desulfhydrase
MTIAPFAGASGEIALVRRLPVLAAIPRARLGVHTSPVEQLEGFRDVDDLWVKRDDLSAELMGGNKVRALEFALARVERGDTVLTVGGHGSTHVLATATHAARLGAQTVAVRWPHELGDVARQVDAASRAACTSVTESLHLLTGIGRARLMQFNGGDRMHYVPLGAASPEGILGQVNAALELAEQVGEGMLPAPARVVVPMGTGATAAGLALGFALARLPTTVVAVRCGPRIGSNGWRVRALERKALALLKRYTGRSLAVTQTPLRVMHSAYGGAYGRPFPAASEAAGLLHTLRGWRLDDTYSAKAFVVALDLAAHDRDNEKPHGPTLFWLTFDGRWLTTDDRNSDRGERR